MITVGLIQLQAAITSLSGQTRSQARAIIGSKDKRKVSPLGPTNRSIDPHCAVRLPQEGINGRGTSPQSQPSDPSPCGNDIIALRYPVKTGGKPSQLEIRVRDVRSLAPGTLTTDPIMELSLAYIVNNLSPSAASLREDVGIISSFFHPHLDNDTLTPARFTAAKKNTTDALLTRRSFSCQSTNPIIGS
jgi:hypothetical protein